MDNIDNLAAHYSRFRVAERLLLTGHSHQAWPDVSFDAQQRAWLDAAELVDDKWVRAAEQAARVQQGFRRLLNDPDGDIALGQNTHELVTRLLSALPLRARPKLVTTDGEFHTIRRQLDRLAEEGLAIVKVAARPAETLTERLARAVDDDTACVLVSSVLYDTAEIVPGIDLVARACDRHGTTLLVDAYHHLNVVPFDIAIARPRRRVRHRRGLQVLSARRRQRLPSCAARVPAAAGSDRLVQRVRRARAASSQVVAWSTGEGAARFNGATYDPASHYRAAAVFAFHVEQGLTAERLREISRRQVDAMQRTFESLDLDPAVARVEPMPAERRGGFLAIRCAGAAALSRALRDRGVLTDVRGDLLRLGPAPYLTDAQLRDAVNALQGIH